MIYFLSVSESILYLVLNGSLNQIINGQIEKNLQHEKELK